MADPLRCCPVAVPRAQLTQPCVITGKITEQLGWPEDPKVLGDPGDRGAIMRGPEEDHALDLRGELLVLGGYSCGLEQDLLGHEATQAMADEAQRPLADPVGIQQGEKINTAIQNSHRGPPPPRGR